MGFSINRGMRYFTFLAVFLVPNTAIRSQNSTINRPGPTILCPRQDQRNQIAPKAANLGWQALRVGFVPGRTRVTSLCYVERKKKRKKHAGLVVVYSATSRLLGGHFASSKFRFFGEFSGSPGASGRGAGTLEA